jgi:hypothetical protein
MGGFPGEKKRSLIFGDVLSIAASRSGVEIGAVAGARAAALGVTEVLLGVTVGGEDINDIDAADAGCGHSEAVFSLCYRQEVAVTSPNVPCLLGRTGCHDQAPMRPPM